MSLPGVSLAVMVLEGTRPRFDSPSSVERTKEEGRPPRPGLLSFATTTAPPFGTLKLLSWAGGGEVGGGGGGGTGFGHP